MNEARREVRHVDHNKDIASKPVKGKGQGQGIEGRCDNEIGMDQAIGRMCVLTLSTPLANPQVLINRFVNNILRLFGYTFELGVDGLGRGFDSVRELGLNLV
jgi:hypothetical protein